MVEHNIESGQRVPGIIEALCWDAQKLDMHRIKPFSPIENATQMFSHVSLR